MAYLKLKNIHKSFPTPKGPRLVLRSINLEIEEGEFVCLTGYSGSGKTTLIALIAGLIQPDAGEIILAGEKIQAPGPDRGVIFQNYSLLPWLSVLDNVLLAVGSAAPNLSAREKKERAEHYIRMVRLDEAMNKMPKELSGGMRQRVAVARGFATEPKVLLLDEPFSALDALTRAALQQELARIWMETKKTVLMITNDVDEAILLSDKIYSLTRGPAAGIGMEVPVRIQRPRAARHISLDPDYQQVRRTIVNFLMNKSVEKLEVAAHA